MITDSQHTGLTIALAGNPNSGKTTLFNALTGSRQRIGNWPGVTVERKEGLFTFDAAERLLVEPFRPAAQHTTEAATAELPGSGEGEIRVVDLPGIYSLAASSEDEAVARDYLLSGDIDLVVNVVDASNIQRNLYLTLQLIEMHVPVLVVLNMADVAARRGIVVGTEHLSEHLDTPVISISAVRPADIVLVKETIIRCAGQTPPSKVRIPYPDPVEDELTALAPLCLPGAQRMSVDVRWVGLKLLEGDPWVTEQVLETSETEQDTLDARIDALNGQLNDEVDVALADARYGFIHGLTRHVSREKINRRTFTERVDGVVMNRILALPIFFGIMYGVFWLTMSVGGAFIDFFDLAFGAVFVDGFGRLLETIGAPHWLRAILADGIGTGLQTVATFIPIIFTMFAALSILEDSGYMSRAAYVMDRFMRTIGLPGKSFVPMMVGFGCTVPAILGTRTLESRRDRFMTIFMAPNMSCGARLPVYALFAAAFFPQRSGGIVFSLYVAGIGAAILTGFLLKVTLLRGEPTHFVMELPPYHAPRPRFVISQAWQRLGVFIKRAGVTITLIVTVLSLLNIGFSPGADSAGDSVDSSTAAAAADSEGGTRTVLSVVARAVTPMFRPMGIENDNWPATVALVTGVFAKEAVVGTLSSLYGQTSAGAVEEAPGIGSRIVDAFRSVPANIAAIFVSSDNSAGDSSEGDTGDSALFRRLRDRFTPEAAYAYLLFVLIYVPCAAALAAAIREMGGMLGWLLALYSTGLAWSVATLFYQFASGPTFPAVVIPLVVMGTIAAAFRILGTRVVGPRLRSLGPADRGGPRPRCNGCTACDDN